MRTIFLTLALMAVFLVAAVIFLWVEKPTGFKDLNMKNIKIGEAVLDVEIADTPFTQARGLSGRASLGENRGMLFVFPNSQIRTFWMKSMNFPIDIIWIRDKRMVGMVSGAQPETAEPYTIYISPEPVDMVLEINAGLVGKLGINIGDEIQLR